MRKILATIFLLIILGSAQVRVFPQGNIYLFFGGDVAPTSLPGHHLDAFSIQSDSPIRTLMALVLIDPMNQVPAPAGGATVFPTLLSLAEAANDSHFVFDPSSATILDEFEDRTRMSVTVEFHDDFPSSFALARAVAADSHTPYNVQISGSFVDGRPFGANLVFVPEPSTVAIALIGFALLAVAGSNRRV